MSTDRFEGVEVFEVHVMRDVDGCWIDPQDIQGIAFAFASTSTPRCTRAALHNDDPLMPAPQVGEEVQRVADISTMQMPAQNQIDIHRHKPLHRPPCMGHGLIVFPVGCRCEVMMGHDDPAGWERRVGESVRTEFQLLVIDPAIGDSSSGCGRIQPNDDRSLQSMDLVQLFADVPAVKTMGFHQSLANPVQGHIMIARYQHVGYRRQSIEELACLHKLFFASTLRKITAGNHDVRSELVCQSLNRLSDPWQVRWPKV